MSLSSNPINQTARAASSHLLQRVLHLDLVLFTLLLLTATIGVIVLYSSLGGRLELIQNHLIRLGIGVVVMIIAAQIPPTRLAPWVPTLFAITVGLLIAVLLIGQLGGGAKRWLDLGLIRFQPSEIMKLGLPLMMAWYLARIPIPPTFRVTALALVLMVVPVALISLQPDLGTAVVVGAAGASVLFIAGLRWRYVVTLIGMAAAAAPVLWMFGMQPYQRARVLTFFDPHRDPLGAGYNIIQSQIAIGSGGLFGKGWLNGTQAHLDFIPERHTDFIFAVLAEEFGFLGVITVLVLYLAIIWRGLWIAHQAQDAFSRLLASGITMTFMVYCFVNIGMVSGVLPVVGLPLPLISYGGSSIVTVMAGFGILMSIHSHRRMWST